MKKYSPFFTSLFKRIKPVYILFVLYLALCFLEHYTLHHTCDKKHLSSTLTYFLASRIGMILGICFISFQKLKEFLSKYKIAILAITFYALLLSFLTSGSYRICILGIISGFFLGIHILEFIIENIRQQEDAIRLKNIFIKGYKILACYLFSCFFIPLVLPLYGIEHFLIINVFIALITDFTKFNIKNDREQHQIPDDPAKPFEISFSNLKKAITDQKLVYSFLLLNIFLSSTILNIIIPYLPYMMSSQIHGKIYFQCTLLFTTLGSMILQEKFSYRKHHKPYTGYLIAFLLLPLSLLILFKDLTCFNICCSLVLFILFYTVAAFNRNHIESRLVLNTYKYEYIFLQRIVFLVGNICGIYFGYLNILHQNIHLGLYYTIILIVICTILTSFPFFIELKEKDISEYYKEVSVTKKNKLQVMIYSTLFLAQFGISIFRPTYLLNCITNNQYTFYTTTIVFANLVRLLLNFTTGIISLQNNIIFQLIFSTSIYGISISLFAISPSAISSVILGSLIGCSYYYLQDKLYFMPSYCISDKRIIVNLRQLLDLGIVFGPIWCALYLYFYGFKLNSIFHLISFSGLLITFSWLPFILSPLFSNKNLLQVQVKKNNPNHESKSTPSDENILLTIKYSEFINYIKSDFCTSIDNIIRHFTARFFSPFIITTFFIYLINNKLPVEIILIWLSFDFLSNGNIQRLLNNNLSSHFHPYKLIISKVLLTFSYFHLLSYPNTMILIPLSLLFFILIGSVQFFSENNSNTTFTNTKYPYIKSLILISQSVGYIFGLSSSCLILNYGNFHHLKIFLVFYTSIDLSLNFLIYVWKRSVS